MQLFDTHAHLDQDAFDSDRPQVLARAAQAGVTRIVAVGVTRASSEACLKLAQPRGGKPPEVYAAVGIHPNHTAEAAADDWDRVVELAGRDRAVALGETGLDRHWDFAPFELQQDYFQRHLALSRATGLPVVIHTRDCDTDMLAMLRDAYRHGPLRGVMHSFVGDGAMAEECIAMGLHISFAGMATYKKSDTIREVARAIPADRLMVETDSPYLSPEPVRKVRRNEPAHVLHTAGRLAEVRGVTLAQLATQTTANANRLFNIP
ncbi:putative deoxyribonuclease YcfH [Pirellulimonas nuda]|uniref:Putative deoxyribonuclease YcfH n=1 Tax=Pirellulimonas nuda TaxID=2528009 RepID=A0A518DGF1_9BACT|nr:TatD family hydrolase [Pirellulimonas nuda]QDU90551.1 putative deoxyribonuclease YcfH [Pirellulimonas nuda]